MLIIRGMHLGSLAMDKDVRLYWILFVIVTHDQSDKFDYEGVGKLFNLYLIWRIPTAMVDNLVTEFEWQIHKVDNAIFPWKKALAIQGDYMVGYDTYKISAPDHIQDLFPISQVKRNPMSVKGGHHSDGLCYPDNTGSSQ